MKLNCDYSTWANDWSSSNENVCVRACACTIAWTPLCLNVHMCGHVQLQAVYSADIISMRTQRWVVLISFPSMPFEQHGNHGGEWIWNKFPRHWCEDSHTVQYFIQTSVPHCFIFIGVVSFYVCRYCMCLLVFPAIGCMHFYIKKKRKKEN